MHKYTHSLQWRHNGHDGASNHQPHDCLLNHLFRRRKKEASKLRGAGLYEGNYPMTGEFPAQMASNAENVSIWWRHHVAVVVNWVFDSVGMNGIPLVFRDGVVVFWNTPTKYTGIECYLVNTKYIW